MNIFTLNPDAKPELMVVLPSKVCNRANSSWLLTRVVQPGVINITKTAFCGVENPKNGTKLLKKEVVSELMAIHEYADINGVKVIGVGHAELFKYMSGGAKFTLNFGRAIDGSVVKVSKDETIDFTGFKIVPFLNPVILDKYPEKTTEVARGLGVFKKLLDGDYKDNTDIEMRVNEVITDPNRALEVLKMLWDTTRLTSDIETTGLDWHKSRLLTISFSPNKDESYCIAVDKQYHNEVVENMMKDYIGRFLKRWTGELIGHNFIGFDIPFLIHMMRGYDFATPHEPIITRMKLTDTILMAYLLNNSTERASIGLKELSFKYMGEYDADVDQRNLAVAPLEKVATYNNYDCRATWLIYEELMPRIIDEGFADTFEEFNDIAYDLVKMKMVGLRIDMAKTKAFQEELKVLIKKDRADLLDNEYVIEAQEIIAREAMKKYNKTHKNKKRDWTEFKEDFNPASPKQKQVLFFDLMNLPVVNRSKTTRAPSSDAGTIAEWLNDDTIPDDKIEAVKLVSEYMTAQKIQSTYVNVMVEKAVEVSKGDFRLFTNFNQTATITGRLSSSGDINLQTIPNSSKYGKRVKELFIAPDGFILATADYSALEDILIANESQDQNKLNIFLKGIDGHSLNAYGYFKDEFKARGLEYDITDPDSINRVKKEAGDLRQGGKSYTFGFTYGAGPKKYGQDLYDAYWATYKGVKKFNDSVITKAMRDGYLISRFSGLRLWFPAINSIDEFIQSAEWRVACNFVIQSGNFLMLRAIHKMQQWIEEEDLQDSVKMILTVHDSVYLYIKHDPAIIALVNEKLIEFMGIPYDENQTLPLTAELDIGTNMVNFVTLDNNIPKEEIQEIMEESDIK